MNLNQIFARARLSIDQVAHCIRKATTTEVVVRPGAEFNKLEERILMSASPLAEMAMEAQVADQSSQQPEDQSVVNSQDGMQLIIVDGNVEDSDELLKDFDSLQNVRVFTLDTDRDGVEQIGELLAQFQGLDALHIVSHGSEGKVALGLSLIHI